MIYPIKFRLNTDAYDRLLHQIRHNPKHIDSLQSIKMSKFLNLIADHAGYVHHKNVIEYIENLPLFMYYYNTVDIEDGKRFLLRINNQQKESLNKYRILEYLDHIHNQVEDDGIIGFIDYKDNNGELSILNLKTFANKPKSVLFLQDSDTYHAKKLTNSIVWKDYPPKLILLNAFKSFLNKNNILHTLNSNIQNSELDLLKKSHDPDAEFEAHMEMQNPDIEKDYTNSQQFTAKNLLKNNPLNIDHSTDPHKAVLMYHILSSFPKPYDVSKDYGSKDMDRIVHTKRQIDKDGRIIPGSEIKYSLRDLQVLSHKNHETVFNNLKNALEDTYADPESQLQDIILNAKRSIMDSKYDITLQSLTPDTYLNRYLNNKISWSSQPSSVMSTFINDLTSFGAKYYKDKDKTEQMIRRFREGNIQDYPEMMDYTEKTLQGKSLNSILRGLGVAVVTNTTPKLDSRIERSGPDYDFIKNNDHIEFLNKNGIQFKPALGKVSKSDLDFHQKQIATSLKDLVNVLDLPDGMMGFNNRLRLQIGVKGKKNAQAYYSPGQNLMYITHKHGLGTIAHEWFHFFDHILHTSLSGSEGMTSKHHLSLKASNLNTGDAKEILDAVEEIATEIKKSFKPRVTAKLNSGNYNRKIRSYILSNIEMFARGFESYINIKMESQNRKNSYLSSHSDHFIYPTKEEAIQLENSFDKLFKVFKKTQYLKKSIDIIHNRLNKSIKADILKNRHSEEAKDIVDGDPHIDHTIDEYHNMVNSPKKYNHIGDLGGISPKIVNQHESGMYMTKPYYSKLEDATLNYMQFPISGWSSITTKAIFDRIGLGHLCEDVSAKKINDHQMIVSKFNPDMVSSWSIPHQELKVNNNDLNRIGMIDFLTNNSDRHMGNIMISKNKNTKGLNGVLAIDHDRNFQYILSDVEEESPSANLKYYLHGKFEVFKNISPKVGNFINDSWDWWKNNSSQIKDEFNKHLALIKDPDIKQHIKDNFEKRAHILDYHASKYSNPEDVVITNIPFNKKSKLSDDYIQKILKNATTIEGQLNKINALRKLYNNDKDIAIIEKNMFSLIPNMTPKQLIHETKRSIKTGNVFNLLKHILSSNNINAMRILMNSGIDLPVFYKKSFERKI